MKFVLEVVRAYFTGMLSLIRVGNRVCGSVMNFNIILGIFGLVMWVVVFIVAIKWGAIKALWVIVSSILGWTVLGLVAGFSTKKEKRVKGETVTEITMTYFTDVCEMVMDEPVDKTFSNNMGDVFAKAGKAWAADIAK